MSESRFDCIVLGIGGIGSAALHFIAQSGLRTLGIDRFEPGHDRGSSHGDTRIIRLAYFEHPDYVPLLLESYDLWSQLEDAAGEQLFFRSGLLQTGPADGEVISGVRRSARLHSLKVAELDEGDLRDSFDGFRIPGNHTAFFEEDAGFLLVEKSIKAFAAKSLDLGARINVGESVISWKPEDGGFTVTTDKSTYFGKRLVVTPGAWASDLLKEVRIPFSIVRKPILWYKTFGDHYSFANGTPAFLIEDETGIFYGFPQIAAGEIKLAEHTGGLPVVDPLSPNRDLLESDRKPVETFLSRYLPGVEAKCLRHKICMYTRSPDEHFVLDEIPGVEGAYFAAGFSGHGYKFAPVIGKALAELVVEGRTEKKIDFLKLNRFEGN